MVEWPSQPLRFESVVLRTGFSTCVVCYNELLKGSVPTGNFAEPRLTSGAFEFLGSYEWNRKLRIVPWPLLGYARGFARGFGKTEQAFSKSVSSGAPPVNRSQRQRQTK